MGIETENNALRLQHLPCGYLRRARWRLLAEIVVDQKTIAAGFVSDGLSVPWPFWILLNPTGRYMRQGIYHDYLLSLSLPWPAAARFFRISLRNAGMNLFGAYALWVIVRVWGVLRSKYSKQR